MVECRVGSISVTVSSVIALSPQPISVVSIIARVRIVQISFFMQICPSVLVIFALYKSAKSVLFILSVLRSIVNSMYFVILIYFFIKSSLLRQVVIKYSGK